MSPTVHVADATDGGAPGRQSTPPDSTEELGHVARQTRPGGIPAVSPTINVADAADRGAPGTQSTPPDSADELGHVVAPLIIQRLARFACTAHAAAAQNLSNA